MTGAVEVKVLNTTTVLPTKKTNQENQETKPFIPLVTFDLPYITFYYNQKLLVYKTNEDFSSIVDKLKSGLAEVLNYFYPLAGRIAKDKDGVLVISNDEEGVEVIEAEAEGITVEDLAEGEGKGLLQEVVPYSNVMNLEGFQRPLLAVQLTKLKDGLALGCAFNHAVLDGHSTWHFMTSWSELCLSNHITVPPVHDRTKARSQLVFPTLPSSPKSHELADPNGPPKPLIAKIFPFSASSIAKIKSLANANAGSKPLSTFQSLGAHVWKAVCRARPLKPEEYTVFAIFIDCRTRLEPPLGSDYFGNAVQAIFTVTAAGIVKASPLEMGATLIQKAIDVHDAKAIEARLAEYEAKPKMFHYTDAGINCVAVGSSPRFKVYDVDFGFGKPERVRSGANNKFDGMMYLYPGREGGGSIDVELTLDGEAMANLEKDDEFLNVVA